MDYMGELGYTKQRRVKKQEWKVQVLAGYTKAKKKAQKTNQTDIHEKLKVDNTLKQNKILALEISELHTKY
jgi:hypothetical protein